MLYEISDEVRASILAIVGGATMQGKHWRIVGEIFQILNNPVQPQAPEKEVLNHEQRDDCPKQRIPE